MRADGRVLTVNIGSPEWRAILDSATYQRGSKFKDGMATAVWDEVTCAPLRDAMEMSANTEANAATKAEATEGAMADYVKAFAPKKAAPAKKAAAKKETKGN